ncbi:MAG: tetratricopeptide repeat protein [Flavobacterium sp.]|uniref:tetratricopeptide repeat protein n=1 Tax=Flavobacterium sp. TaxID=239 RepID=UPI002622AA03|nr:tetratricopeptide repeat protein [Flavobacterium sp.]MDD5149588.1 tetratricopeptide repeat protein [Flavobacterium sp.]
MLKKIILLLPLFFAMLSFGQSPESILESRKQQQDSIIEESFKCAENYNYTIQMKEWQECLDSGLKKDSTIAYLWQQKAMPYFKARKYEIGMAYLDKAVKYDKKEWLPYRAFMKCIFVKSYRDAIVDFEECIKLYGNGYRMDHSYNFYIGLCYLQLNEYAKAEKLFKEYNEDIFKNRQGLEHPTALFYYGISKYEQSQYEEAILIFDKALKIYPTLSDAKYYKAVCLAKLGKKEEATQLFVEAKNEPKDGYFINEDNAVYETYPYQIRWK